MEEEGDGKTVMGEVETRELKERLRVRLGGWGWINGQQEMKRDVEMERGYEEGRVVEL